MFCFFSQWLQGRRAAAAAAVGRRRLQTHRTLAFLPTRPCSLAAEFHWTRKEKCFKKKKKKKV